MKYFGWEMCIGDARIAIKNDPNRHLFDNDNCALWKFDCDMRGNNFSGREFNLMMIPTDDTEWIKRTPEEMNYMGGPCLPGQLPLQPRRLASRPPCPAPWTTSSVDMAGVMSSLAEIKRALNANVSVGGSGCAPVAAVA